MSRLAGVEYQELCFAHVFEIFIRQCSGVVGWAVKQSSVELRAGSGSKIKL